MTVASLGIFFPLFKGGEDASLNSFESLSLNLTMIGDGGAKELKWNVMFCAKSVSKMKNVRFAYNMQEIHYTRISFM